ncbi:MAG: cytidine deaminase [Acidobacteria bacterium]|nr:cytidine deaminase [Acidobacteriota bacterium]
MSLIDKARAAQATAYAPYSKYHVGCALETNSGEVFTGCNIENASYGATLCAERVALFKAVSEGHRNFRRILIATDASTPAPPCGLCRQALSEFCTPDLEIILCGANDTQRRFLFSDLFPHPFDQSSLV